MISTDEKQHVKPMNRITRKKKRRKYSPEDELLRYRREQSRAVPVVPEVSERGGSASVMRAGEWGPQMRKSAYFTPGAFLGADFAKGLTPLDNWGEEEWRKFFVAAGWSAAEAGKAAAGAVPGEFVKPVVVPVQKGAAMSGCHTGVKDAMRQWFKAGNRGTIPSIAEERGMSVNAVRSAVNKLMTSRELTRHGNCRPYVYSIRQRGASALPDAVEEKTGRRVAA